MDAIQTLSPCSRCPLRRTGQLDVAVLEEFVYDSLMASMAHYDLVGHIIPYEEQIKYEVKHIQVKVFLGLLRNTKLGG